MTKVAATLTHVDLFSGIGGFALAARWAGFRTVQFVEVETFCQRVLAKNFPGTPIHGDVRTFDAAGLSRPTLLTGGFPCQDISGANSRAVGIDGDRSGLVREVYRIAADLRPRWLVLENSPRLRLRGGDRVFDDLRAIGYAPYGFVVEAAAVGALHSRERAAIVAHSDEVGSASPGAAGRAYELARNRIRLGSAAQLGRLDVVLRPGAIPAFRVEGQGPVVSGPTLLRGSYGVPGGLDRVGALGNAIVPQAFFPILAAIASMEGPE